MSAEGYIRDTLLHQLWLRLFARVNLIRGVSLLGFIPKVNELLFRKCLLPVKNLCFFV